MDDGLVHVRLRGIDKYGLKQPGLRTACQQQPNRYTRAQIPTFFLPLNACVHQSSMVPRQLGQGSSWQHVK
jgi:hypothetical protein